MRRHVHSLSSVASGATEKRNSSWSQGLPETVHSSHSSNDRQRRRRVKKGRRQKHWMQSVLLCFGRALSPHAIAVGCFFFVCAWSIRFGFDFFFSGFSRAGRRWTRATFSPSARDLEIALLAQSSFSVLFPSNTTHPHISIVPPWDPYENVVARKYDHGGLVIKIAQDIGQRLQPRMIFRDLAQERSYEQLINGPLEDDWNDFYYNFDDDRQRNPLIAWDDDTIQDKKHCRRTNWHRDLPINCNSLHEFDVEGQFRGGGTRYLGAGSYREVYLSKQIDETVVFKAYYWGADYASSDFEFMRMDAIVNERLGGSPRIVNIYGFCGTGIISEAMIAGDLEKVAVPSGDGRPGRALNDKEQLDVRNELTGTKKLEYSLDMAEAVALLHSYPNGVIVHDDIQLSQFLITDHNSLRLNDFNRAEIMLWNEADKEYCRYRNNPGHGDWRAPEEYFDYPLNEQIDVWSLGNNMYSLLTGMYPFYDEPHNIVKDRIKRKETGFVDSRYHNRSFGESTLATLIPRCWIYDPDERINIFDLVDALRTAVEQNKAQLIANLNNKKSVSV